MYKFHIENINTTQFKPTFYTNYKKNGRKLL